MLKDTRQTIIRRRLRTRRVPSDVLDSLLRAVEIMRVQHVVLECRVVRVARGCGCGSCCDGHHDGGYCH